jgi:hypothetical protein
MIADKDRRPAVKDQHAANGMAGVPGVSGIEAANGLAGDGYLVVGVATY